jgi:hypothetical protein
LTDLAPITPLGVGPQALAVHKEVSARSLESPTKRAFSVRSGTLGYGDKRLRKYH